MLQKPPFRNYDITSKEEKPIPVKLNKEERVSLKEAMTTLQQTKQSTALKQLAWIGLEVLRDKKFNVSLDIALNNRRKNKRLGIADFD